MTINAWGTDGSNQFALPMERAIPLLAFTSDQLLVWDSATQVLKYKKLTDISGLDFPYLGSYVVDPTAATAGRVLQAGFTYYNSISNTLRLYDGAAWFAFPGVSSVDLASKVDPLKGSGISGYSAVLSYPAGTVGSAVTEAVVNPKLHPWLAAFDGVTDDTLAVQAALNSVATKGGIVDCGNNKVRLLGNLTIPAGCTLVGRWVNPDQPGPAPANTYSQYGGLRLGPGVTIIPNRGSTLASLLIMRDGMTFPSNGESLFAGTAITATASHAKLENLMVLGFNKLFAGTGQRYVLNRVFGDNKNGIDISSCPDVCYIHQCHMWPFAENTDVYPNSNVNRSGIAYYIHDVVDWAKLTDCFSYAYFRGFQITNANSNNLLNCSADHNFPRTQVGAIGFLINGTSNDTKMVVAQTAAQAIGVYVDTVASAHTEITNLTSWETTDHSVLVNAGDCTIIGGGLRDTVNGISVNSAASRVIVDDVRFRNVSVGPINLLVSTGNVMMGTNDFGDFAGASGVIGGSTLKTVASAASISLQASFNNYAITGVTNVSTILGGYATRVVRLQVDSGVTFVHSTATNGLHLKGNVNFVAAAGATLSLLHNGDRWFQL